jgi:hypothetical protein
MTYPHQMNCSHSDDGWCLDCVNKLGMEMLELEEGFSALETFCQCFGFARLYRCFDGWYVSNQTDEGIGGCDPRIRIYGKTPEEAVIATAHFIRDPKIPSAIACPHCGVTIPCKEFVVNKPHRREVEFFCWNDGCYASSAASDICPACMGPLEVIEVETLDGVDVRTKWDAKCKKCGKIFPRGNDIDEEYPDFKMEKIDLEEIGVDDAE